MAWKNKKKLARHLSKMGKAGGAKTSEAKAAAARENGKRGGRPPQAEVKFPRRPSRRKPATEAD